MITEVLKDRKNGEGYQTFSGFDELEKDCRTLQNSLRYGRFAKVSRNWQGDEGMQKSLNITQVHKQGQYVVNIEDRIKVRATLNMHIFLVALLSQQLSCNSSYHAKICFLYLSCNHYV